MDLRINSYNNKYTAQNKFNQRPQSFTGKEQIVDKAINAAEENLMKNVSGESKFFSSVSKKYDKFCEWVGEKVCRPAFNNGFIDGVADKIKYKDNAIKFFLIGGSAITSGVYMQRTLTNDKMDKDRKKTLAVNQFLTFCLSTLGALFIDANMKKWWSRKKEQFFDLNVPNAADIRASMEEKNKKIELKNKGLDEMDKQPLYNLDTYLEKYGNKHFIDAKDYDTLMTKMKGFAALRSIIVFALVYRFLVPVLVTKPANWLCDAYLNHKKANAEKLQNQDNLKTAA